MTPIKKNSISVLLIISLAALAIYFATREVDTIPGFAILYCDTATFSRMVNINPPPPSTTANPAEETPVLYAEYGSLFFKYYLAPENLNLNAWSFKPGRGPTSPDFDPQPDLRLTIGRNEPDIKFHTGDHIGDFILNKSSMILVQNSYRASRMPFVLFYPQRVRGEVGVQWRIVLARFAPLRGAKFLMNDTSAVNEGGNSTDIYLNPIPPKGMNRGN